MKYSPKRDLFSTFFSSIYIYVVLQTQGEKHVRQAKERKKKKCSQIFLRKEYLPGILMFLFFIAVIIRESMLENRLITVGQFYHVKYT